MMIMRVSYANLSSFSASHGRRWAHPRDEATRRAVYLRVRILGNYATHITLSRRSTRAPATVQRCLGLSISRRAMPSAMRYCADPE